LKEATITDIALSAGSQTLRVDLFGGSTNLNWLQFRPVSDESSGGVPHTPGNDLMLGVLDTGRFRYEFNGVTIIERVTEPPLPHRLLIFC